MLYTCIEYVTEGVMRTVTLTTAPANGGLAVTLGASHISETKNLVNYPVWTESGFRMVARSLTVFKSILDKEVGRVEAVKMAVSSTAPGMSIEKPYCVLTLESRQDGYKVIVTGPVLRMSVPISGTAIPLKLGDLLQFLLTICDPRLDENVPSVEPIRIYEGEGVEPFIFVEELPEPVLQWFIAHLKQMTPSGLHRQEQVATARAYREFCGIYD